MLTKSEAKRHARTLASKAKKRAKMSRYGQKAQTDARAREAGANWMADMGKLQHDAAEQAQESRRSNPTMPEPGKKGLIGQVKSFFGGGGR